MPSSTLLDAFRHSIERRPSHVAVEASDGALTYAELDAQSNQLANHLRSLGVTTDTRVGISLHRGALELVSMLATLKAGGAYVPLDPSHPQDRLRGIIDDSAPQVMIVHAGSALAASSAAHTLVLDNLHDAVAGQSPTAPQSPASSSDLAYILFTSGSTGRPKGVEIMRGAFDNFLASMARDPGLAEDERLLAITTTSFDIAGLELFLPLWVGATTVIVDRATAQDPQSLRARLEQGDITLMQATPATWRLLLEAGWRGDGKLRMLCGGEALPPTLADRLLTAGGELWNMYGPTETTVWSSLAPIRRGYDRITVGRPIAETQMYVLDPSMQPVAVGQEGELWIGGAGLARGYRGRADLTTERFVQNPHGPPGDRIYRTGDLGRMMPDGRFECLGRIDHQVKIRGFRIELGEIEAVLRGADGVQEALVVADQREGEPLLVAYWTGTAAREALIEAARSKLPSYMIPSAYVAVEAFPLNTNGKIDRKSLPKPQFVSAAPSQRTRPPSQLENRIQNVWAQVLGLAEVPLDQNFFTLGGNSALAVRVVAQIERELGVRVPLAAMIETPTIEALAASIEHPTDQHSLVALNDCREGVPLFLIHDVDGATLPYLNLARRLSNHPVYGVQPYMKADFPTVHTRIEDMAKHYVAEIRAIRPHGPYLLGGLCTGGIVAAEMVLQLEDADESAHLVAVLDAADVQAPRKAHLENRRRLDRIRDAWKGRQSLAQSWQAVANKVTGYLAYQARTAAERIAHRTEIGALRFFLDRGATPPSWLPQLSMRTICDIAEAEYRPRRPLREAIVLFRASKGDGDDEPYVQLYADALLGWDKRSRVGVHAFDVPGGHSSMLHEPNVAAIADILRPIVAEAAGIVAPPGGAAAAV